jgi:hypothetical protein
MRVKSFYSDLQPSRVAKTQELPPFYEETKKLIMDYFEYHCKRVGSKLDFAEYMKKMNEFPLSDDSFLKDYPDYAFLSSQRKKKRKKAAKT